MKLAMLNRIKELYEKENKNIIEYLKEISDGQCNTLEDILISYDFQAGVYTEWYENDPKIRDLSCDKLANLINNLGEFDSVLEVGIGEGTVLGLVMPKLQITPHNIFGLDLSWSRIKYARKFVDKNGLKDCNLVTGDMFNLPFSNDSIELVYTFQAIEPNGGREREALEELYRVASRYIVLVEPCYENACELGKERMEKNGYIKGLYNKAIELGYKVIMHEPLGYNFNELNPVSVMIIEKNSSKNVVNESKLCCPLTKTPLVKVENAYFSPKSLLAYPIINNIPCLLNTNAIVATKMLEEK